MTNNNCNIFLLPKFEIIIYFVIYISFISYAIFNIYLISNELPTNALYGFETGWGFLKRLKDTLGDEWEHAQNFLFKNYIWYIGHIVVNELCRFYDLKKFYLTHFIIGFAFLLITYKKLIIITVLIELLSFYLISKTNRKSIIWIHSFIWLAVMNIVKNGTGPYGNLKSDEFLQLILILAWNVLKCLSFSLNRIENRKTNDKNLYNWKTYCGYVFYFPTIIFGPCMIFDRYIKIENKKLKERLPRLLMNITRVLFWSLLYNLALHYFYVHYLSYDIEEVKKLNFWAFYGYGYLMGQFFHLQYTVSYGLSNALSQFDGINTPNQPRCIARVHLYSDMWKYFDQGLYEFLFRYIYTASCSKTSPILRKFAASLLTFAFIYVWHGLMTFILIWTILNFICLILEKLLRYYIINSLFSKVFLEKYFGQRNHVRIYGILGSQLFILAAFSNFYFFANTEIGNYFFKRTYSEGISNYLIVTIWCYCIFQCSEFISYHEQRQKQHKNKFL